MLYLAFTMKRSTFLPLLLLLQIFFFTNISISNSQVPAFNKYILSLQFTKSLCNKPVFNKCDPNWNNDLPNEFTIHGLWENEWVGTKTSSGKQFLLPEIYSNITLRDGLYQTWPNAHVIYTPGGNKAGERRAAADRFWQWEWNEHGQFTYLSSLEYFKTTYDLFTNVGDIYGLFKREGLIHPGGYINLNEATASLRNKIGADPFLKCIKNNLNEEFLWEIEILYDRASLSTVNHYQTDWSLTCSKEVVSLRISSYSDQEEIMD